MARSAPLKTRSGCTKCKQRRVKCDEQRPSCGNCVRLGIRGPCRFDVNSKASKGRTAAHRPDTISHQHEDEPDTSLEAQDEGSFDILDMALMHFFTTKTCVSIARTGTFETWQTTIPLLAYSSPYLTRGLVAMAALHRASVEPAVAHTCIPKAMASMQHSLPEFRSKMLKLGAGQEHAAMAFSSVVGIYSFALPAVRGRGNIIEDAMKTFLDAFGIMRGTLSVIRPHFGQLQAGPLSAIFQAQMNKLLHVDEETFATYATMNVTDQSNLQEQFLQRLALLDGTINKYANEYDLQDLIGIYHHACITMTGIARFLIPPLAARDVELDAISAEPETAHLRWPVTLEPQFIKLLQDGDTPAMTILAYFSILMGHKSWYMMGWRDSILAHVEQTVKVQPWRRHIQWLLDLVRESNTAPKAGSASRMLGDV